MDSDHFAPDSHHLFTADICTNLSSLETFLLLFHDFLQQYENAFHKRNVCVTQISSDSVFNLHLHLSVIYVLLSNLLFFL